MNKRVGYARAFPDDQNLDLQRDVLALAGCSVIYEDAAIGKSNSLSEMKQWCKSLDAGDTLVVWRLDLLGRTLSDLVRNVAELQQRGIGFESVNEKIETTSEGGKGVFQIFITLAEFERNLIKERAHAGLAAARARGRAGGRKPKLDAQQIREIRRLMTDPNISVTQLAERHGVSRTTLYKVAKGNPK